MDRVSTSFKIFFAAPFWIGIVEQVVDQQMYVCKITFGPEPKDYDIYEYVLKFYGQLRFSPAVDVMIRQKPQNPKRRQREIKRQMTSLETGTKSQQALQLQREQQKTERRVQSREQKEVAKDRLFELKQRKRKEKHRGR